MGFFDNIMEHARRWQAELVDEAKERDAHEARANEQSPREKALLRELAQAAGAAVDAGEAPGLVRYALLFSGEVQFVGFRYTNMRLARERGLTGWAHNEDDGTVTMEIQGPPATIGAHLGMLHAYYREYGNRVWLEEAEAMEPRPDEADFAIKDLYGY